MEETAILIESPMELMSEATYLAKGGTAETATSIVGIAGQKESQTWKRSCLRGRRIVVIPARGKGRELANQIAVVIAQGQRYQRFNYRKIR